MRGKKLPRLGVAALLAIGILALVWHFSLQKYAGLISLYRGNQTALETSVGQLQAMMAEIKSVEQALSHSEYIKVCFRRGEGTVTLYQSTWQEKKHYAVEGTEYPLSNFPELEEPLQTLYLAGVHSVYVFDFSDTGGGACEIWYGDCGETLVYSADGFLTHPWDAAMSDGPGYRFYQKKLGNNWFATVSRYDRYSPYWET